MKIDKTILGMSIVAVAILILAPLGGSVATWDVQATYTVNEENDTVDLDVAGLYSHVINCGTSWQEVSSTTSTALESARKETYSWSYTRAELQVREQNGTVVETTLAVCPDPELAVANLSGSGWTETEIRGGLIGGPCNWDAPMGGTRLSPPLWGTGESVHYEEEDSGVCLRVGGAQLGSGHGVAFTGTVKGVVTEQDTNQIPASANSCDMIVGLCWDRTEPRGTWDEDDICPFGAGFCNIHLECDAGTLFLDLGGIGTWRCEADEYTPGVDG